MDRRDLRRIDQMHLVLDVLVAGVCSQSLGQLRCDFGTEFRRCRFGIGDDKEVVDVLPLVTDLSHNAVNENLRFTGTGRRRDQQVSASVGDDCLLLFRQRDLPFFAHNYSSFVSYLSVLYHIWNTNFHPHRARFARFCKKRRLQMQPPSSMSRRLPGQFNDIGLVRVVFRSAVGADDGPAGNIELKSAAVAVRGGVFLQLSVLLVVIGRGFLHLVSFPMLHKCRDIHLAFINRTVDDGDFVVRHAG